MIYPRHQPYPFIIDQNDCDCCEEDIIPQLVNQTDVTQFQNIVEPPAWSPQVIGDPTFTLTVGGGSPWTILSPTWTVGGGQLCKDLNGVASASQCFQLGVFTVGSYYQVNIVVDSLTGGTFDFTIAGNAFSVSAAGEYQFNVLASADGARVFGDDDVLGCLSLYEAYEIFPQTTKWLIKDSAGDIIEVLDQENDPDAFEINGKHITGYIDWTSLGLDDGCYCVCVAAPSENTCSQNFVAGGEFPVSGGPADEALTGWQLNEVGTGIWGILDGSLRNSSGAIGVPMTAIPINAVFCDGISYDIEVSLIPPTINVTSTIKIGSVIGPPMSASGVFNFTIVADGPQMVLTVLPSGAPYALNVDYIRVKLTNTSDYMPDACGPQINLGTHDCTHLINACHNSNVYLFNYTDSMFSPHLRLNSKIGRATFGGERVTGQLSNGKKRNNYLLSEEVKQLQIDTVSYYAHRFLETLRGYRYVGIDGKAHHVEDDEYQPVYGDNDNCNAQSVIQISKEPEENDPAIIFRDCTGVVPSCAE